MQPLTRSYEMHFLDLQNQVKHLFRVSWHQFQLFLYFLFCNKLFWIIYNHFKKYNRIRITDVLKIMFLCNYHLLWISISFKFFESLRKQIQRNISSSSRSNWFCEFNWPTTKNRSTTRNSNYSTIKWCQCW